MDDTDSSPGRRAPDGTRQDGIPCQPPIEIRKDGGLWQLAQFEPNADVDVVLGERATRIDAMRAAKDLMDDKKYPCMVMWSSPGEMQDAYWNPLFEELHLKYDPIQEAWAVVPAEGYHVFDTHPDKTIAREHGREIQLQYDFKHFVVFRKDGKKQQQADHHFITTL